LTLVVALDRALPSAVVVGSSTAVFCAGVCCHPEQRIVELEIVVDGVRDRPAAFGMPRPDQDASRFHSGFWGTVSIPARAGPGVVELRVAARLASGAAVSAKIGEIEVVASGPPPPASSASPASSERGLIAVCMATFEPDPALFAAQVESLRAQHDQSWICVISDDCSSPAAFEQIRATVGEDPRFAISRSEVRLGFYRNFERALRMAPGGTELIALCDQDDRWHPDKLSTLRGWLGAGGAMLAYSDQRLVDASGKVLRDTLWRGRRNNYDNLASMLVANTITGAATLFRRELLEVVLPFPDTPGFQFHDHWLAVAALAAGEVAYVDRPLYDYVQHAGAVFGDVTHGGGRRERTRGRSRAAYFYGYLAREVQAQTLLLRCASVLTPHKRRTLRWFIGCDSSLAALAWLALRPVRCIAGRTETLGSESELARGIAWKRLTAIVARHSGRRGGPFSDAGAPPLESFTQKRLRRWRASI
jgi:glycosyltransferase involved in cell wall biosynthesis